MEIARKVNADGVHLGPNDMSIQEARTILGKNKIIGYSANNFEDIQCAIEEGADYIGIGPYRETQTKPNHRTPLGANGYKQLITQYYDKYEEEKRIPFVAIGGIKIYDIEALKKIGVENVAVSSGIQSSDYDATMMTVQYLKLLNDNVIF